MNNIYKLSEEFQFIKLNADRYFCYNSILGNSLICSLKDLDFLKSFKHFRKFDTIDQNFENGYFDRFTENKLLVPLEFHEREDLGEYRKIFRSKVSSKMPFKRLGFFLTSSCNLSCRYCTRAGIIDNESASGMISFDNSIIELIDYYYQETEKLGRSSTEISFTGGEPFLNWKSFESIINYITEKHHQIKTKFYVSSNITTLDEKKAAFLKKHHVSISASLDGIGKDNDSVRYFKNGTGTFKSIVDSLKLINNYEIDLGLLSITLTDNNFSMDPAEILEFCKKYNIANLRIEPDLAEVLKIRPSDVAQKLMQYEELFISNQIEITGYWKSPYLKLMKQGELTQKMAHCQPFMGGTICVNPDSSFTVCPYIKQNIGKKTLKEEFWKSPQYLDCLENSWIGNIKKCRGCSIEGICLGGCFITREHAAKGRMDIWDYRCELQKNATRELLNFHL